MRFAFEFAKDAKIGEKCKNMHFAWNSSFLIIFKTTLN